MLSVSISEIGGDAAPPAPAFSVPAIQGMLYDEPRHVLLMPALDGLIHRFDLRTNQLLESWTVASDVTHLGGGDISPDGEFLYTGERTASPEGPDGVSLFKIRLSDGEVVRRYTYTPAEGEEIGMTTLVAVPQGVFFTTRPVPPPGSVYGPQPITGDYPQSWRNEWIEYAPVRRLDPDTGVVSRFTDIPGADGTDRLKGGSVFRSGDRSLIAFTDNSSLLVAYEPATGRQRVSNISFAGDLAINDDGSRIASSGFELRDRDLNLVKDLQEYGRVVAFDSARDLLFIHSSGGITRMAALDARTGPKVFSFPAAAALFEGPSTGAVAPSLVIGDQLFSAVGSRDYGESAVYRYPLVSSPTVTAGTSEPFATGTTVPLTVTMRTPEGEVDADYRGTVDLTAPDSFVEGLPLQYQFTAADAGVHTFDLRFPTPGVQRVTGADAATGFGGTFTFQVDGAGPVAVVTVSSPEPGAASLEFTVDYEDESPWTRSTFGDDDLVVTAPDGSTTLPVRQLFNPLGSNDVRHTERYIVDAPGGTWDAADNGLYTIKLAPGAVTDAFGHAATGQPTPFTFHVPGDAPNLVTTAVAVKRWPRRGVVAGTVVDATVTLRNDGASATGPAFELDVVASSDLRPDDADAVLGKVSVPAGALAVGTSRQLRVKLRVPSLPHWGSFHVLAQADAADALREADETDNVAVGPLVDLPGEESDVTLSLGSQPPAAVPRGGVVGARILLRNRGPARLRGFAMIQLLDLQGQDVARDGGGAARITRPVKLQPGGSKAAALRLKVPRGLAAGDYLLSMAYLPSDGPSEVNWDNNEASMTLHVE